MFQASTSFTSTDRSSTTCSSKKVSCIYMLSAHCQIPFSSVSLVPDNKYHFRPSLWSQITIQISLIFGSNATVSDMLYTFLAATCWYNDNSFALHLHMELELYQTTHQHYLLGASQIFISANDNWFTLYKCGLWCASLPDVWPRNKIWTQRVRSFSQFHCWCQSSIDRPPLQKWMDLHASNIWLTNSEGKANDG